MTFIMARQHGPATNLVPTHLVAHCTVSPCAFGGALKTANYFHVVTRPASAHWVFDPGEGVRCLPDNIVGYHAPPNTHSLGYEMTDPQAGSAARWSDALHLSMLSRTARQVAADAVKYGIPIVKLSSSDLLKGKKGICGHADVSAAWHQTTHTDPGVGFPWTTFIDLVKQYAKGGTPPPVTPPGTGDQVPTQTYSQSVNPESLAPGRTVLGVATAPDGKHNGVSFAEGPAYFSGYVGLYIDSDSELEARLDLHTVKTTDGGKTWVDGSVIDEFEVGMLQPGTNKVYRPVQIYLPTGYRLRSALTNLGTSTPVLTRGFTRLLKWSI